VQGVAGSLGSAQLAPAMIGAGIPAGTVAVVLPQLLGAALTNVPAGSSRRAWRPMPRSILRPKASPPAPATIGLLSAAQTGRYYVEYPTDIDMVGVSFNTDLGSTGISWQGEVSLKNGRAPAGGRRGTAFRRPLQPQSPQFGASNQIGNYLGQYNKEIEGYRRHDVWTAQIHHDQGLRPASSAPASSRWSARSAASGPISRTRACCATTAPARSPAAAPPTC
jgi:hypothetical protein